MDSRKIFSPYCEMGHADVFSSPYPIRANTSRGRKKIASRVATSSMMGDGSRRSMSDNDDCSSHLASRMHQEDSLISRQTHQVRSRPKHVKSQQFLQLMTKRARDSENTLRYLLKLSNNTFYATLKHEIEVMKKKGESLQQELSLNSDSILKILKCQSEGNVKLEKILSQNQKLEASISKRAEQHEHLQKELDELKLMCQRMKIQEGCVMPTSSAKKSSPSKGLRVEKIKPPRSAPSLIPRRKSEDHSRVVSEPTVCRHKGSGDCGPRVKSEIGSASSTSARINYDHLRSDLELTSLRSKHSTCKSSKTEVGTSVGAKQDSDDLSLTNVEMTRKRNKRRQLMKLLCCQARQN